MDNGLDGLRERSSLRRVLRMVAVVVECFGALSPPAVEAMALSRRGPPLLCVCGNEFASIRILGPQRAGIGAQDTELRIGVQDDSFRIAKKTQR